MDITVTCFMGTSFSSKSRYRDSHDPHTTEVLPLVTDLSDPVSLIKGRKFN